MSTATTTKPASVKITCEREKLLDAFLVAASVAPKRSPSPIIENVKMVVEPGSAQFVATDLENSIIVPVEGVTCNCDCELLLPVARFGSILRESTDDELTIVCTDSQIKVKGQRSEFKLSAISPQDFPAVGADISKFAYSVKAGDLLTMIRRSIFAADVTSSRYALGGAMLEFATPNEGTDCVIYMVCTDGRRMAVAKSAGVKLDDIGIGTPIVPVRAMQLIQRSLVGIDADVVIEIAISGGSIVVNGGGTTVIARLLEGRFPKWRGSCPIQREDHSIPLMVGEFNASLRQAAIVASDESHGVDITVDDQRLTMTASTAEVGVSRIEMEADYSGPEITLTLDHRFVGEFLKVLDRDQQFNLRVKSTNDAVLFTVGGDYAYVVMPLAKDG